MSIVANGPAVSSVSARLERLPSSRWHIKVRTLIGTVTFFEAFDQLLTASALPVLTEQWKLSTGQGTMIVTSGSVGMLLGALVAELARRPDRPGEHRRAGCRRDRAGQPRRRVLPGFALFTLFRFVQGLGIGGVVPVAATYINEIARADHRGRFVLLYELIFPVGLATATLVASWVVPSFGWRVMFVIGALPVLLVVVLRRQVPESPRWLLSRGRVTEAEQVIARIEKDVAKSTGAPLPEPGPATAVETSRGGLRDLFTGRYLRRTAVVSALWFVAYYVNHGIATWLPSLYTKEFGLDLRTALNYALLSNVTGLIGCLLVALVIDRVGRRVSLTVGLGGAAVALFSLAVSGASSGGQVAVWASVTTLFVFATNVSLYLYTPELYPTRSRARGASFGGVWNRLGVILGPIVVGAIISSGAGLTMVFTQLGCVAAVGAVIALFAVETKGKTLEELNS